MGQRKTFRFFKPMRRWVTRMMCIAGLVFSAALPAWIGPVDEDLLLDTPWAVAGSEWRVDPWLLYAITLEESAQLDRQRGVLMPWPYIVHRAGTVHRFDSHAQAKAFIRELEGQKLTNFDVGPLQINHHWHGDAVDDPTEWLSVSHSLDYAARLLDWSIRRNPDDIELAIGWYRSMQEQTAREYARSILELRRQLPGDAKKLR